MARLFVNGNVRPGARFNAEHDSAGAGTRDQAPGRQLWILWEEGRPTHPEGYAYSRFCELFRNFERLLSPTMRQQHVVQHKAFVDYLGKANANRRSGRWRGADGGDLRRHARHFSLTYAD